MTGAEAIDLARDSMWVLVVVAGPIMLVGLVVGVVVGVFQALTQVQEATLVFVPKIMSIFVAVILLLPFMAASMSGLMDNVIQRIIHP